MAKKFTVEKKTLPIELLENNKGQVYGLPKNPRYVKDERFMKLCKSITDDPEYMEVRELIVWQMDDSEKYIVIGGNMRLRACLQLGWTEVPCKILPKDTPVAKLRAYTIKDNEAFGNTDWDILANEWDSEELKEWGMEIDFLQPSGDGDSTDIDDLFEESPVEQKEKPLKIEVELPNTMEDVLDEVKGVIEQALADYPDAKVK